MASNRFGLVHGEKCIPKDQTENLKKKTKWNVDRKPKPIVLVQKPDWTVQNWLVGSVLLFFFLTVL